ncbi:MAG TPA: MBL fold metallo-hydrolase [Pseudomonadales bacterium]
MKVLVHYGYVLAKPAILSVVSWIILCSCSCGGHLGSVPDFDEYSRYDLPQSKDGPRGSEINVTFLGTSTLLFDDGETQILVDAFVTRPGVLAVAFGRLQSDNALIEHIVRRKGINRLKAVFITHSHYDHALDAVAIIKAVEAIGSASTEPVILWGSESTRQIGLGGGMAEDHVQIFRPGVRIPVGHFEVTALPSKHSPPTFLFNDIGTVVEEPLSQPARFCEYSEGGTYDILIRHGKRSILVKPGANYVEDFLDGVEADILFLGIGRLGKQSAEFREAFYRHTVQAVEPKLVVPIHWDNFFKRLSGNLPPASRVSDSVPVALDFLRRSLEGDGIRLGMVRGLQTTALFGDDVP